MASKESLTDIIKPALARAALMTAAALAAMNSGSPDPAPFDANHDGIYDRIGFGHTHGETMQVVEYGILIDGQTRYLPEKEFSRYQR